MKRQACILGNSHLAAIRAGWKKISIDYDEVLFDMYWTAPKNWQDIFLDEASAALKGSQFHSRLGVSGELSNVDVRKYDFFCFTSPATPLRRFLRILATHSYCSLESKGPNIVSYEYLSEFCIGLVRRSPAVIIYKLIRRVSDAPVFICLPPFPNEIILGCPKLGDRYENYLDSGNGAKIANLYLKIWRDVIDNFHDEDLIIVQQPERTLSNHMFTKKEYAYNHGKAESQWRMIKVSDSKAYPDYVHMNEDYGIEIIRQIFTFI